jgi:transposase
MRVRPGGIDQAGNARARRALIEGAWTYCMQARVTMVSKALAA